MKNGRIRYLKENFSKKSKSSIPNCPKSVQNSCIEWITCKKSNLNYIKYLFLYILSNTQQILYSFLFTFLLYKTILSALYLIQKEGAGFPQRRKIPSPPPSFPFSLFCHYYFLLKLTRSDSFVPFRAPFGT